MKKRKSGDEGGKQIPPLYLPLQWLEPHLKHRPTTTNKPSVQLGVSTVFVIHVIVKLFITFHHAVVEKVLQYIKYYRA